MPWPEHGWSAQRREAPSLWLDESGKLGVPPDYVTAADDRFEAVCEDLGILLARRVEPVSARVLPFGTEQLAMVRLKEGADGSTEIHAATARGASAAAAVAGAAIHAATGGRNVLAAALPGAVAEGKVRTAVVFEDGDAPIRWGLPADEGRLTSLFAVVPHLGSFTATAGDETYRVLRLPGVGVALVSQGASATAWVEGWFAALLQATHFALRATATATPTDLVRVAEPTIAPDDAAQARAMALAEVEAECGRILAAAQDEADEIRRAAGAPPGHGQPPTAAPDLRDGSARLPTDSAWRRVAAEPAPAEQPAPTTSAASDGDGVRREVTELLADARKEAKELVRAATREQRDLLATARRDAEALLHEAERARTTLLEDARRESATLLADARRSSESILADATRTREALLADAQRAAMTERRDAERTSASLERDAGRDAELTRRDADASAARILADAAREADRVRRETERSRASLLDDARREAEESRRDAARLMEDATWARDDAARLRRDAVRATSEDAPQPTAPTPRPEQPRRDPSWTGDMLIGEARRVADGIIHDARRSADELLREAADARRAALAAPQAVPTPAERAPDDHPTATDDAAVVAAASLLSAAAASVTTMASLVDRLASHDAGDAASHPGVLDDLPSLFFGA